MRQFAVIIVGILVVGSAGVRAETETDAPVETVALRFDWPVGLSGTTTQTRERTGSGAQPPYELRYRFALEPDGEALRFAVSDVSTTLEVDHVPEDMRDAVRLLNGAIPGYRVGRDGSFLGIDNFPAFQAIIQKQLESVLSEVPEESVPGIRGMLDTIVSEPVLMAKLGESWNAIVAAWAGADLEYQAVYEAESEEPFPVVPGMVLPMRTQFSIDDREPCTRGGVERSCVSLFMTTEIDPAETSNAVRALMNKLVPPGSEIPDDVMESMRLEVVTDIRVVTEPASLIPHRASVVRRLDVSIPGQGATQRVDAQHFAYDYDDGDPKADE